MASHTFWTLTTVGILVGALASLSSADFPIPQVNIPCAGNDTTFKCVKDGKCISKKYMCDGIKHCQDNSDEQACDNEHCDEKQSFTCHIDNECLPISWHCDGQNDCNDGSDEISCTPANTTIAACSGSEFQCKQGLCIPHIWHCDGHPDCLDDSDEEDCDPQEVHKVPCHEFSCGDDKENCIPMRWVCDGVADCPNGSDEVECFHPNEKPDCLLSHSSFSCKDHSACIGFNLLCDGVKDCKDGSDEAESQCNITCPAKNRCSQGCVFLPNHKKETCFCRDGFLLAPDNTTCFDINECDVYGTCSQECVNKPGGFSCDCEDGYVLDVENNRTCIAEDELSPPILYFSAKSEIGAFNLRSHEISTVSSDKKWIRDSIGVSYDGIDNRVYWTNVQLGNQSIVSSKIDGSDPRIVVNESLKMPEDIAVDAFARNVYYTDSGERLVGVCTIDGKYCHKLITDDVDQPRGLALYPAEGLLFYSDWGRHPHISRAGMDGSLHIKIIRHNIKWPNGIAIDTTLKKIFWSDAQFDRLEYSDFNGDGRKVILEHVIRHPFSLAVFEDTLYWSDWHTKEIQSCNKFNGDNHETIVKNAIGSPMGIHIFHPVLEPMSHSPCYGSPCSHICLLAFGGKRAVCKCPNGMKLSEDRKTCNIFDGMLHGIFGVDKNLSKQITARTLPASTTTDRVTVGPRTTESENESKESVTTLNVTKVTSKPRTKDIPVTHSPDNNHPRVHPKHGEVSQSQVKQHSNVISIIVGVCVGLALFIILTVVICVCVKRRRHNKGAPLRFPNPTFGLPATLKGAFKSDGAELKGVEVDGSKWQSLEKPQRASLEASKSGVEESLRFSNQLEPASGRLEFVNCSWSQPKLHAGGSSPNPQYEQPVAPSSEPMRRSVTNPELSKSNTKAVSASRVNPLADDTDSEDGDKFDVDEDAFSTGWESDKCQLIK